MKYKFVKIREVGKESGGTWYLEADSLKTIEEHWGKYAAQEIKDGMDEVAGNMLRKAEGKPSEHYKTYWGSTVSKVSEIKGKSPVTTALELENKLFADRVKYHSKYGKIYLGKSLAVFMPIEGVTEIVEEITSNGLVFPDEKKPTVEDVKYMQWEGGWHWYAKVGKYDVVDGNGNQKWGTKGEAEDAAKWFIANY